MDTAVARSGHEIAGDAVAEMYIRYTHITHSTGIGCVCGAEGLTHSPFNRYAIATRQLAVRGPLGAVPQNVGAYGLCSTARSTAASLQLQLSLRARVT